MGQTPSSSASTPPSTGGELKTLQEANNNSHGIRASTSLSTPQQLAILESSPSSSSISVMMKGWVIRQPSPKLDVSTIEQRQDIPVPEPKEGEVLVELVCCGLNPVDFKRLGITVAEFPAVLGVDGAGTITKIGPSVNVVELGLQIGSPVYFHGDLRTPHGTFAEYCICDARTVCKISPSISFAEAAAVPCAGWTAYVALFDKLVIQSGKTIFISGGAGGVAGYCIQIAKYMKLQVISTCGTHNVEYLLAQGVDCVIDYSKENILARVMQFTGGHGVDYAVEAVSTQNGIVTASLLAFGGQLCSVVGAFEPMDILWNKQLSVHHVFLGGAYQAFTTRDHLRRIGDTFMAMLAAKVLHSSLAQIIQFDQIPSALGALQEGHVRGKIVASFVGIKKAKIALQERTPATKGATGGPTPSHSPARGIP